MFESVPWNALIKPGSAAVVALFLGRLLRRSQGIAVYLWVLGIMATVFGVFAAAGILDVDFGRALELARTAREVVRGLNGLRGSAAALVVVTRPIPRVRAQFHAPACRRDGGRGDDRERGRR